MLFICVLFLQNRFGHYKLALFHNKYLCGRITFLEQVLVPLESHNFSVLLQFCQDFIGAGGKLA